MKNIKDILEEFDETLKHLDYLKTVEYTEYDVMNNNPNPDEEIKQTKENFIKQTFREFIEVEIERLEVALLEAKSRQRQLTTNYNKADTPIEAIKYLEDIGFTSGESSAINDQIKHYQKLLEELN